MKEYRQKLRDATEGLDTVEKIQAYTFPTEVTKVMGYSETLQYRETFQ